MLIEKEDDRRFANLNEPRSAKIQITGTSS
jgi:hypothetical protein